MTNSRPPAAPVPKPIVFFIGKNSDGHWVAQDEYGGCGGMFADREGACGS